MGPVCFRVDKGALAFSSRFRKLRVSDDSMQIADFSACYPGAGSAQSRSGSGFLLLPYAATSAEQPWGCSVSQFRFPADLLASMRPLQPFDPTTLEQTWPTEAELAESEQKKTAGRTCRRIRVPKDVSEYEQSWYEEEVDGDGDDASSNEDEEGGEASHPTNFSLPPRRSLFRGSGTGPCGMATLRGFVWASAVEALLV